MQEREALKEYRKWERNTFQRDRTETGELQEKGEQRKSGTKKIANRIFFDDNITYVCILYNCTYTIKLNVSTYIHFC